MYLLYRGSYWYRGSIKDSVPLKHREADVEAEAENETERHLWKDVDQY